MQKFSLVFRFGVFVTLLGGAVLSSCSDDDKTPKQEFLSQYCAMLMPCCDAAGLSSDPTNCENTMGLFTSGAVYDQEAGDACLAAMQKASSDPRFCTMSDDVLEDDGACDRVFKAEAQGGGVEPGGTCERDSDCAGGPEGEGRCMHVFVPDGSDKEICMIVGDGALGSKPCVGEKKGNWTSYDQPDELPEVGYICDMGKGLYCDTDTRECKALHKVGEECSWHAKCVLDAYCDSSTDKCVARVPVGGSCEQGGDEACVDGAYCDDNHTCQQKKAAGEPCKSYNECIGSCVNDKCKGNGGGDLALGFICGPQ